MTCYDSDASYAIRYPLIMLRPGDNMAALMEYHVIVSKYQSHSLSSNDGISADVWMPACIYHMSK